MVNKILVAIFIFIFINCYSFCQEKWYIDSYNDSEEYKIKETGIYGCLAKGGQMFVKHTTILNYVDGKKEGWSFAESKYGSWFLNYKNDQLQKAIEINEHFWPHYHDMEGRLTESFIKDIITSKTRIPKNMVATVLNFKDDKLNEECLTFDSKTHQVTSQVNFKNGMPDGQYIRYVGNNRKKHLLTFQDGKPTENLIYTIIDKDTVSYYTLNNKYNPQWSRDSIGKSIREDRFYSDRISIYSIIKDALKPLMDGPFKQTYSGLYETPNGNQDIKIIRTGFIEEGLAINESVRDIPHKASYYYEENGQLWYSTDVYKSSAIGTQEKYDMRGRLISKFFRDSSSQIKGLYCDIEYDSTINEYHTRTPGHIRKRSAKCETYKSNNGIVKRIYFDSNKDTIALFNKRPEYDAKLNWEIFDNGVSNYKYTISSDHPNYEIFRVTDSTVVDTVFFSKSTRIKEIRSKLVSNPNVSNTYLHGPFREFYFDGTLKNKGDYVFGVKVGPWKSYEFEQLQKIKYLNDLGEVDSVSTKNRARMVYHNTSGQGDGLYPNISSPDGRFVLYAYEGNTDNAYLYDMEIQKVIRSNINLTETILSYLEEFWNTEFCFLSGDGKNIIIVNKKERYNHNRVYLGEAYQFIRFSLVNETIMSSFGYNEISDQKGSMPFGWMSEAMIYDNHKEEFLCLVGDGYKYGILRYSFLHDSVQFIPTEKEYRSLFQHENQIICANKSSLDYFSKENFSKVREYVIKDSADYIYDSFHYSNGKIMVIGKDHKSRLALYIYDEMGELINRIKLPEGIHEFGTIDYYKGNYFLLTGEDATLKSQGGVAAHVFKLTEKLKKLEWITENFSWNQEKLKNGTGCTIMTDYSPRLYNGTLLMTMFPTTNNDVPKRGVVYDLKDQEFHHLYPFYVYFDPLFGGKLINGEVHYFPEISYIETNYNRKGYPNLTQNFSLTRLDIDLSTGSANLHDYQVNPFRDEPEKQAVWDKINKDETLYYLSNTKLSSDQGYKDTTENGKNCRFNYNEPETNSSYNSDSYVYYPNSKLIYHRSNEAKVIFYNYLKEKEREKTVNFTIDVNGNYLFYSPDKYYLGSKGIHENYYFTRAFKAYPLEQFDLKYNRPDIILDRLGYADSSLIAAYHSAYKKRLKKMGFTEDMLQDDFHLPEIKIENFEKMPTILDEDNIDLNLHLEDSKYKLDRINVWVNDVATYGTDGISLRDQNVQKLDKMINVELAKGENKVQVSVLNQAGAESYKETFEVECSVGKKKPNLYLITIGESEFEQNDFNLTYAAKDAKDIASLFPKSKVYDEVFTKTLTNDQVTRENVVGLQSFLEKADINDHVMVFLAGHGVLSADLDYYLATYDMDFTAPEKRGLMYEDLEGLLDGIKPLKKTLILDACHSGEIDKEEVELASAENTFKGDVQFRSVGKSVKSKLGAQNTLELTKSLFTDLRKGTGATVISSAGGMEFAMEGDDWNNGLFTYALLNGIESGEADLNGDKEIWLSELKEYVGQKVTELSNGKQQPTSRIENQTVDFRVW